jgi:cytosine/adenosine deaminase-related metal-dependent hydrolase
VTVALGTDSRITGSLDLLDELRAARAAWPVPPHRLFGMVTSQAARLLRQPRAGRLVAGGPADLVVVPPLADEAGATLLMTTRRDIRMVVVEGRPLVGDPEFGHVFRARKVTARALCVDTALKLADSGLVRRIAGCPIVEPGVSVV